MTLKTLQKRRKGSSIFDLLWIVPLALILLCITTFMELVEKLLLIGDDSPTPSKKENQTKKEKSPLTIPLKKENK